MDVSASMSFFEYTKTMCVSARFSREVKSAEHNRNSYKS